MTVFQSTPYGALLRDTRALTLSGKYQEAKADWEEILRQDRNCQLAYSGLARAYLAEGEYTRAMTLARQGCDRDTYALAFDKQRNAFLTQYFWILLPCGLVLIGGLLTVLVLSMRKKLAPIKNKQLRLMLNTAIRPVQSFNEIKEKKEGFAAFMRRTSSPVLYIIRFAGTVRRISLYLSSIRQTSIPCGC